MTPQYMEIIYAPKVLKKLIGHILGYTGKPPTGSRNQCFLGRLMGWFAWELANWFAATLLD